MRIQKRLSASAAIAGTLLALPSTGFAAAGAQALARFVQTHLIDQALLAFWGIAAAALFYYAIRMILEAQNDDAFSNAQQSFVNAMIGFAVIAIAAAAATAFTTTGLSGDPITDVNPILLDAGIASVSDFIITMSIGIFVLMVVIQGIRMVITRGEEGDFEKARKLLLLNILGVVVMLLAFFIVHTVSDVAPGILVEEMAGLARFILTLIGFLAVIALIIAGVFLITSVDESRRDRAKTIVIGTLITLALVLVCYTLIVTFV